MTKVSTLLGEFRINQKYRLMKRIIPKSSVRTDIFGDSVKDRVQQAGAKYNIELYERAMQRYSDLASYRHNRARNYRYVFVDQWGDRVQDDNGNWVTERERISKRTGGVVLQNNHLFKIVNTLVGIYAKSATQPICYARKPEADRKSQMMTNALQTNWDRNEMKDLLMDFKKELICGGMVVAREEWASFEGVEDSYTYEVNPTKLILEKGSDDPRSWDISMIGEIRDYTLGALASRLVHSKYDYQQLYAIYTPYINANYGRSSVNTHQYENESWDLPPIEAPCRTYEIWTLEHKLRYRCVDIMDPENPMFRIELEDLPKIKAINEERMRMGLEQGLRPEEIPVIEYKEIVDQFWHFQMLGPDAIILDEYDSPFDHKGHPYTVQIFNWVNGDIIPFISVAIDQQRYINRLITLHDLAISATVKGVKMIPRSVLGGLSEKEFAKQFIEIDGFIFYEPDDRGNKPEVVVQNSTNIGTADLLQLEISFISDITNVSDTLQGKTPPSGTPASRYLMQTDNATTSLAGLMRKFTSFETGIARKKMKVIQQYYEEGRNISTSQSNGYSYFEAYSPKEVQNIDFECKIGETNETTVGRAITNELLEQLEAAGAISVLDRLRYGYYPGTEGLRQELESREEQAQAQGEPGAPQLGKLPQTDAQGNVPGSNLDTVRQLQQILSGNGRAA